MKVTKRDGRLEELDIANIRKQTVPACEGLEGVSYEELELSAQIFFTDGIKTSDIQESLIKAAQNKIELDTPNWTYVAARLRLYDYYHKIKRYYNKLNSGDVYECVPLSLYLESNKDMFSDFINKYINALKVSKKPLLLIGRGIRAAQASELFKKFIAKFQIPVVTSLLGVDVLPYTHPLRVGFIGTYGNRWANYALGSSDVLLVLGSRIDLRQTGADIEAFKQGKQIFHVDIDSAELNNRFTDTITLNTDLVTFFEEVQKIDYS